MNIRKFFTRISGDNATRHFVQSNPDCPRSLREDAIRDRAGRPGFGPRDLPYNRSLELLALSL